MRLDILNRGYRLRTRLIFAMVRLVSGTAMPDAARLVFYRPEYYGKLMSRLTQEAMRGPSEWSVGERELMAAYVSKVNGCEFCIGAHSATSSLALQDSARVAAALSGSATAPIDEPLRATLKLLGKLTREHSLSLDDMRSVLRAGVSAARIEDALAVCFAFNLTNRLSDAFGFEVLSPHGFAAGAKVLLKRGYR